MLYLSGARNRIMLDDLASGRVGLLQTPRSRYRLAGVKVWAMDNGCYTNAYPGDDEYLAYLGILEPHRERCLFVAAPDVVGDAEATLTRSAPMLARLRERGWPAALVLQDGMDADCIPWDDVDWVFVGGSTEFKLGAEAETLIAAAKAHGVKVHVGRVNSGKRFRRFAELDCDSADGTFVAFAPERNYPQLLKWISQPVEMRLL